MSTEINMELPFGGAPKHESSEDAQRPVGPLVSRADKIEEDVYFNAFGTCHEQNGPTKETRGN